MTPEVKQEIAKATEDWSGAAQIVRKKFRVTDQASLDRANDLVRQAREAWDKWELERTAITKPIMQAKRATDDHFKPVLQALTDIEHYLRAEIGSYIAGIERERVRIMRESAAQLTAGIVPTEVIPQSPKTEGITATQVWAFEVVDPTKVPRELCSPDEEKIQAKIWYANTATNPPHEIPGVRFFLKPKVTIR